MGSFWWVFTQRHIIITGRGWQLLNNSPISNAIYDNGLYDGIWCLLPKDMCCNQGGGYFYFPFLLLTFCVGAMIVIATSFVVLVYWTWYSNKPNIFYCCVFCLSGIVYDVSVAANLLLCPYTHYWQGRGTSSKEGYFWLLLFIHGVFNLSGHWVLYWLLLIVSFQYYSHIKVSIPIIWWLRTCLLNFTLREWNCIYLYDFCHDCLPPE